MGTRALGHRDLSRDDPREFLLPTAWSLGKCPWLYGARAWDREEQEVLSRPVEI